MKTLKNCCTAAFNKLILCSEAYLVTFFLLFQGPWQKLKSNQIEVCTPDGFSKIKVLHFKVRTSNCSKLILVVFQEINPVEMIVSEKIKTCLYR